jgi:hypothetical protein
VRVAGSEDRPREIAKLERWLELGTGSDAALALLEHGVAYDATMLFGSNVSVTGVASPTLGMQVLKSGAVSDVTRGLVDGVAGSYGIDYSIFGDQHRWIDGFRIVVDSDHPTDEISLVGDSGAAWIDLATGNAVGLHFAGEDGLGPTAEYALAQDLPRVMRLLDVTL